MDDLPERIGSFLARDHEVPASPRQLFDNIWSSADGPVFNPSALTPNHPRVSRSSVSPWRTAPVGTNPNAS